MTASEDNVIPFRSVGSPESIGDEPFNMRAFMAENYPIVQPETLPPLELTVDEKRAFRDIAAAATICALVYTSGLERIVENIEDKNTSDTIAALGGSAIGWGLFIAAVPYLQQTKLGKRYDAWQEPKIALQQRIKYASQRISDLKREQRQDPNVDNIGEIAVLRQEICELQPRKTKIKRIGTTVVKSPLITWRWLKVNIRDDSAGFY